ncbi:uncharacterized protein L969DRAFT_50831 [Mixia osmundae IAM 14324]|uniref:PXA domain-containing protein n=1 Tax=Mixia osmundae (strain CBS 9802 / IAM 14324 / JCM 22182 / KY 12970) TaxID=764103 RepID=G7E0I5_MIXOS|nr:uncharacterized protein L969DRAFT_50831 [Mixia osmundae IAM 14324]KEI38355.1 hypothetical protein L969DRAFT_50831 [Mixia osmundae IAM 14324]GAA96345.1 hypothetical protein E5Q_03011 [Mixia osmundae IAM 14324]
MDYLPADQRLLQSGAIVGFLVVTFTLGIGRLVLATLVACALALFLSTFNEVREIGDAFLNKGKRKLPIPELTKPVSEQQEEVSEQSHHEKAQASFLLDSPQVVELKVPPRVKNVLADLLDLVIRDFVEIWYNASVTLGDTRFLKQTKSALNTLASNVSSTIEQKDTKELAIYLMHSTSAVLTQQLKREDKKEEAAGEAHARLQRQERQKQRIDKIRRSCEELLMTLGPRSITLSPLATPLMVEILTLQVWKTIQGLDDDWINRTLISYLESQPEDLASKAADAALPPIPDRARQSTEIPGGMPRQRHRGESDLDTPLPSIDADDPAWPSAPAPQVPPKRSVDETALPDPSLVLEALLIGSKETKQALLLKLHALLTKLDRKPAERPVPLESTARQLDLMLSRQADSLSESFQVYLESLAATSAKRAEGLIRLYTQVSTFRRVVETTSPSAELLRQDALSITKRVTDSALIDTHTRSEARQLLCQIALDIDQQASSTVLLPLQSYLFREIASLYFQPFLSYRATLPTTISGRVHAMNLPRQYMTEDSDVAFSHTPSQLAKTDMNRSSSGQSALRSSASAASSSPSLPRPSFDERDGPFDSESDMTEGFHDEPAEEPQKMLRPSSAPTSVPASPHDNMQKFTVSVTDVSPPSAYSSTRQVKVKKDLSFIIAVEAQGLPGFIIQRSFPELEKLNLRLQKALPQAGTREFPRAMLPSTNMQSTENLCIALESYLANLLRDDRYASSTPVLAFFDKERAGAKSNVNIFGAVNRSLLDTSQLASKGLTDGAKGITTGLNSVASVFTTPFKIAGIQPAAFASSSDELNSQQSNFERSMPIAARSSLSLDRRASPSTGRPSIDRTASFDRASTGRASVSVSASGSGSGYAVPDNAGVMSRASTSSARSSQLDVSEVETGAVMSLPPTSSSPLIKSDMPALGVPAGDLATRLSFDDLLAKDRLDAEREQATRAASKAAAASSAVAKSAQRAGKLPVLSARDVDVVINASIRVLEEAYQLADTGTWNLKRGILAILQSVLSSTYSTAIAKYFVTGLVALDEDLIASKLEDLRAMFWPGGKWWTQSNIDQIVRTAEDKEQTRLKARKIWTTQAPNGLKIALGASATAEAFGRIHDGVQAEGAEILVSTLILDLFRFLLL